MSVKKKPRLDSPQMARRRVSLARDVLSQLELGNVKYEREGYYFRTFGMDRGDCAVCNLGALLVARYGGVKETTEKFLRAERLGSIGALELKKGLCDMFSVDQMVLIEAAFEGREGPLTWYRTKLPTGYKQVAGMYNKLEPRQAVEATALNIIKNKGTFVP